MSDYGWWQRAQDGAEVGGPDCPVHDGVPQLGFYRTRATPPKGQKHRDQPWLPVAIFEYDDEIIARVGDDIEDPAPIWIHCAENHVSEAAYRKALVTAQWGDVEPAAAPKPIPAAPVTTEGPPPIGHNAPLDEAAAFMDQIETVAASLVDYQSILSDDQAARAQSLRSRFLELHREANKKREAEKSPHFQAAKAVDERWRGPIAFAKDKADELAALLSGFFTAKARQAAEEERKERKAREAAEKAAAAGMPSAAPSYAAPAPEPTVVKGGYGRAASVKVVKVVTAVTDWNALWGFMQGHPEVRGLLTKLAQRAIDKGHTVPGVTVEEERKVV